MAKEQQELALGVIDSGKAVCRIDELIEQVARDVIKRPRVKKKRTVTLKITMEPEFDEEAEVNFPKINWSAAASIPGVAGRTMTGFVKNGKLMVNINDPHGSRPDQPTMFEDTPIIPMANTQR